MGDRKVPNCPCHSGGRFVGPKQSLEEALQELERTDPEVRAASNSYDRMARELRRTGAAPEVAD